MHARALFWKKMMEYKHSNGILRLTIEFSQTTSMTYRGNILQNTDAQGDDYKRW